MESDLIHEQLNGIYEVDSDFVTRPHMAELNKAARLFNNELTLIFMKISM